MKHINQHTDYDFEDFVPDLQKKTHKGFRLGSFYIRDLYILINDYELACKLHTVRMVAQFMRDMVFLVRPPADVAGLFLVGEGGAGKSWIFDMITKICYNGMTDSCASTSPQVSFLLFSFDCDAIHSHFIIFQ